MLRGAPERARIVREQDERARRVAARERAREVLAWPCTEVAAVVVDAGEVEAAGAADRDALVAQHAHAEPRTRASQASAPE